MTTSLTMTEELPAIIRDIDWKLLKEKALVVRISLYEYIRIYFHIRPSETEITLLTIHLLLIWH
jgi:hypothetical protein